MRIAAQMMPIGCIVRFNYYKQVFFVTLAPLMLIVMLLLLGITCAAIEIHRIRHGRLHPKLVIDFAGIPSAIARRLPASGPSRPANLVLSFHAWLNLDKPGSIIRLMFVVVYFTLPTATRSCLRLFVCEDIEGSWLEADYSIDCDSDAHTRMQAFAGIFLAGVFLAGPYLMLKVLQPFCDRINPPADSEKAKLAARANDADLEAIRVLYNDWRPHLW